MLFIPIFFQLKLITNSLETKFMIKKILFSISIFLITNYGFSQQIKLSKNAEISIITAGPGKVLYEGFGHTTIRIKDTRFDNAYNYGIFDFNAPNFYLNFTKGRLLYKLQSYPFHYFVREYQKDQRWIKEQILNLSQQEKQQVYNYLQNNALPENATYLYDPFFNNCATKPREILETILKDKIVFDDNYISNRKSFRQLMNDEISWNNWGSFGINLALGNKLDKKASIKEYMYLPDYVYTGFNRAKIKRKSSVENLVKIDRYILKFKEIEINNGLISPLLVFIFFLITGSLITYKDIKSNKRTRWFDFILFFTTGLIGLLIVFLWFFTNHSTTPTNYNFLWAFAPNIVVGFILLKHQQKTWVKTYISLLLIFLILTPVIWLSNYQQLPLASVPILLLLLIRYLYLNKLLSFHK